MKLDTNNSLQPGSENESFYLDLLLEKLEFREQERVKIEAEKQKKYEACKELRTQIWQELYKYCVPFQSLVTTSKDPVIVVGSLKDFRISFTKLCTLTVKFDEKTADIYILLQVYGGEAQGFKDVQSTMQGVVNLLFDRIKYTPRVQPN